MVRASRFGGIPAVLILLAACGCDGSRGVVPVEGRITFGGNQPPAPGYLYFTPQDMQEGETGSEPRPATAIFMHEGLFRPTTFTAGDGLRPGVYDVRVECHAAAEGGHGPGRSAVPANYEPPPLTVPADGPRPVSVTIDVP